MFKKKVSQIFKTLNENISSAKNFSIVSLITEILPFIISLRIMKCVMYLFHNKNFRLFKISKKIYIHNAEVLLSERLSDKIWARNYFEALPKGCG